MSVISSMLAISTMNVLKDSVVSRMSHFTFEGHTFSPVFLSYLAEEIRYNTLKVERDRSPSYDAITNTIYLNFSMPANAGQRAMIVHEATHALFDFQNKKMDIATSESLSYIAQCMYGRLSGAFDLSNPDSRLGMWEENAEGEVVEMVNDGVFKTGWRIAGKIIAGGTVDSTDVTDMRNAVSAHPFYQSKYTQKVNFNGYI